MDSISKLIDFCAAKHDEAYKGGMARLHGCYLARGNYPLCYFAQEKDAKAFCYHMFGKSVWEMRKEVQVVSMKNYLPMPGDFVLYDGSGDYDAMTRLHYDATESPDYKGGYGYITGSFDKAEDGKVGLIFNTYGISRSDDGADGSGGPCSQIDPATLTLIGFTVRSYERWSEGLPRAHSMGSFNMTVPVWRWTGNHKTE